MAQYVINNWKTGKYLYTSKGWFVDPEDLLGDVHTVAKNLYQKLTDGRKAYAIWAAHIVVEFLKGAKLEDIDIHIDEYFGGEDYGVFMWMENQDLDEWCQSHAIVPDEWLK
jgi:hypothetical protein